MTSEVRRRFLDIMRREMKDHDSACETVLMALAMIPDKHGQQFRDANMILRYHRETAEVCKRMIKQYTEVGR